MRKGQNFNHPAKGASIKVQPIRSLTAIQQIKGNLKDQPRNLCLFTLGINTAYRASELLSLSVGDVADLRAGDALDVKQIKTKKYRLTVINSVVYRAIQHWLEHHPRRHDCKAPLFLSQRGSKALTVAAVNRLIKQWCKSADLAGNYGSHTLRKTWGYQQRTSNDAPMALLVRAYRHTSETQTLDYLGIIPSEICALYHAMQL